MQCVNSLIVVEEELKANGVLPKMGAYGNSFHSWLAYRPQMHLSLEVLLYTLNGDFIIILFNAGCLQK